MCNCYYWVCQFVEGCDLVEVGCGVGQGLDYLVLYVWLVVVGDIFVEVFQCVCGIYGDRFDLRVFDVVVMLWGDGFFDVVIFFEVIYYLFDIDVFMCEVKCVLCFGGYFLVVIVNKDFYDFVLFLFLVDYYGVEELVRFVGKYGFLVEFWGYVDIVMVFVWQCIL